MSLELLVGRLGEYMATPRPMEDLVIKFNELARSELKGGEAGLKLSIVLKAMIEMGFVGSRSQVDPVMKVRQSYYETALPLMEGDAALVVANVKER